MKNYCIKTTLIIIGVLGIFLFSKTAICAQNYGSFVLNLFYDHGNLLIGDRTITTSPQTFFAPKNNSYSFYSVQLYDAQNNLLISIPIDQKNGQSQLEQGEVIIQAPFNLTTAKMEIKNSAGKLLLEIPLSEQNFCNRNKICEPPLGESFQNCSYDCAPQQTAVQPSQIPTTNTPFQSSSENVFLIIIWIFSGIVLAAGLAMIYIAKKRQ